MSVTMEDMANALDEGVDTLPPEDPAVRVECIAELQDLKISKASNGANYDVTFEIPLETLALLAESGDGHDLTFKKIGADGATVRRMAVGRDADGGKHGKIVIRLSQSEIKGSAGRFAQLVADSDTKGTLVLEPTQMMLDLTTKAE